MDCEEHKATSIANARCTDALPDSEVPHVHIRVFGGFEVLVDGNPVDYGCLSQRRIKVLMAILALNHGQDLRSNYIAESIWPTSPDEKQRKSFYNLWYLMVHAIAPPGVDKSAYFSREQYSCRLLDDHVSTDVAEVEQACDELSMPDITPVDAVKAYQKLQASYRGDVLPGEEGNVIIERAREEWRERVAESLFAAAKAMTRQGEAQTALWLVKAASRIDGTREDLSALHIRLLIDMGRPAAALRVYNDMHENLIDELGVAPAGESERLIRELVDTDAGELKIPASTRQRRRRGREAPAPQYRAFPRKVDLPV